MPITTGFNHVATLTADLDRLVAFYGAAFGGEVAVAICFAPLRLRAFISYRLLSETATLTALDLILSANAPGAAQRSDARARARGAGYSD